MGCAASVPDANWPAEAGKGPDNDTAASPVAADKKLPEQSLSKAAECNEHVQAKENVRKNENQMNSPSRVSQLRNVFEQNTSSSVGTTSPKNSSPKKIHKQIGEGGNVESAVTPTMNPTSMSTPSTDVLDQLSPPLASEEVRDRESQKPNETADKVEGEKTMEASEVGQTASDQVEDLCPSTVENESKAPNEDPELGPVAVETELNAPVEETETMAVEDEDEKCNGVVDDSIKTELSTPVEETEIDSSQQEKESIDEIVNDSVGIELNTPAKEFTTESEQTEEKHVGILEVSAGTELSTPLETEAIGDEEENNNGTVDETKIDSIDQDTNETVNDSVGIDLDTRSEEFTIESEQTEERHVGVLEVRTGTEFSTPLETEAIGDKEKNNNGSVDETKIDSIDQDTNETVNDSGGIDLDTRAEEFTIESEQTEERHVGVPEVCTGTELSTPVEESTIESIEQEDEGNDEVKRSTAAFSEGVVDILAETYGLGVASEEEVDSSKNAVPSIKQLESSTSSESGLLNGEDQTANASLNPETKPPTITESTNDETPESSGEVVTSVIEDNRPEPSIDTIDSAAAPVEDPKTDNESGDVVGVDIKDLSNSAEMDRCQATENLDEELQKQSGTGELVENEVLNSVLDGHQAEDADGLHGSFETVEETVVDLEQCLTEVGEGATEVIREEIASREETEETCSSAIKTDLNTRRLQVENTENTEETLVEESEKEELVEHEVLPLGDSGELHASFETVEETVADPEEFLTETEESEGTKRDSSEGSDLSNGTYDSAEDEANIDTNMPEAGQTESPVDDAQAPEGSGVPSKKKKRKKKRQKKKKKKKGKGKTIETQEPDNDGGCGMASEEELESDGLLELYTLLNVDPFASKGDTDIEEEEITEIISKFPEYCSEKFKLEAFTESIYTLFALSAFGASVPTISMCLEAYPAAIEECDRYVGTSLHYACSYKASLASIKFLVEKSPDSLLTANRFKRCPLHMACMFGADIDVIAFLTEQCRGGATLCDAEGMTPLHIICDTDDVNIGAVKALIDECPEACVIPNKTNGQIPLHTALSMKVGVEVVRVLVDAAPDSKCVEDSKGEIPHAIASRLQLDENVLKILEPSQETE